MRNMLPRAVYLRDSLPIIFLGHVGDVKNAGAEGVRRLAQGRC